MTFHQKARYGGPFDSAGVPLLDYRGTIGRQYNPIAIAQYGLGCLNLAVSGCGSEWKTRFYSIADWMAERMEPNGAGRRVWMHHFDWEYFRPLRAPWYSGLAQGQGLALLVRAYECSGERRYFEAAEAAFAPLNLAIDDGGTLFLDHTGNWWIEEYITDPPTHILNGFMWALWGVYDYWKLTSDSGAQELWDRSLITLEENLERFDTGYWSLYDLSPTAIRNVASPFYHALHLVQLEVMYRLSGKQFFRDVLKRWQGYQASTYCRKRAWVEKAVFKLFYF